jgi:hypothetical protein
LREDLKSGDLSRPRVIVVDPARPGSTIDAHGDGGECSLDGVEGGLGTQVVVDEGPARAGIDVVQLRKHRLSDKSLTYLIAEHISSVVYLPNDKSGATLLSLAAEFPLPVPAGVAVRFALHQLAHVRELLELVAVSEVLGKVSRDPRLGQVPLVVRIYGA